MGASKNDDKDNGFGCLVIALLIGSIFTGGFLTIPLLVLIIVINIMRRKDS